MVLDIFIRSLNENEIAEALSLVWSVFMEYEAPDYSKEGVEEFYKSIHDESFSSFVGAFAFLCET